MHRRAARLLALILLVVPVPSSATAATTLPAPVAYWGFDEASGSTLVDQSGNGRDGSFSGQVTRVDDGVYDRALRLQSTSTSATAAAGGLSETYPTVSLWVRSDDVPTSGAVLFEKGARACGEPTFGVYVDGAGLEVKLMSYGGTLARARILLDLGLWDGEWHHIAFTKGVSDVIRIYVDGTVWGMGHGSATLDYTEEAIHDFAFGSTVMGPGCDVPKYVGDLDDIRIYDRDLNPSQIGALEPPIPTTTTVTTRSGARAYDMRCWAVNVDPAPLGSDVRVSELLSDGREVDIGLSSNDWCALQFGVTLARGSYFVPLRFDTKGTHQIRARYIPGDPWQASTSPWVDQSVAGVPTTTHIQLDPVAAGEPFEVRTSVGGSETYMTGSISLFDRTSGTPTLIETKAIPFTGASNGHVTFQLAGHAAGTYRLEARYLGDSEVFEPSSTTADLVVTGSGPPPPPSDTTPPTATAPKHSLVNGSAISGGRTAVRLGWTGFDAASGIARYELAQSTDGGAWAMVSTSLTAARLDRPLLSNHAYRFRVRAVDGAGNIGAWMAGPTFRLTHYGETSSRIRYSGTWAISRSAVYWGSQAKASSRAGARATISVTGRSVEWVARKGPGRGRAQVYVNGALKATVDLYASTYQNQRVVWAANWSSSATRTISIRVLGTSGRPRVDLDAFVVGS
jgi:concanavalin A-like lectin/glucanase superfamily protein